MAHILSQAQAAAVYSAMCALNNVSGKIAAAFDDGLLMVKEQPNGYVTVYHGPVVREVYEAQSAFATAYGLK